MSVNHANGSRIGPSNLMCVAPMQIGGIWPAVEPMLDAAFAALDEVTPPDMRQWLSRGDGLLWVLVVDDQVMAACTTSLIKARGGLACRAVACGGSDADWAACMSVIEDYARREGCYKTMIDGRPGWGRVLPGYASKCVSFEKVL